MADTTLDEARRCHKCGELGRKVGEQRAAGASTRGAMLHLYQCENQRCKHYGQIVRTVQVNPDGSIPPAITRRDKQYPARVDLTETVRQQMEAQAALETSETGGEITKR